MLRQAEARSRFAGADLLGGWAVDDQSRLLRVAAADRRTSLIIVLIAAIAAMASVVFDLRLPAAVQQQLPPVTIELSQTTAPAAAADAVDPTAAPAIEGATTSTSATADSVRLAADPSTSAANSAANSAAESPANTTAAADVSAVNAEQTATTDAASSTESATLVDPASRLRNYLGLSAGVQLPVSFVYIIEAGDTASSIAAAFGLNEATVLFNNFDIYDPNQLTIGHEIVLPPVDGLVYTVQPGDAFSSLMHKFQADEALTLAWPANEISNPQQIYAGQTLLLVQGSASVVSTPSLSSGSGAGAAVWSPPIFKWPLGYDQISDPFGTPRGNAYGYHTGVDFTAPVGTIVGSTAAGQISVATWGPSYGNWIEIDHGGGYKSRYAHLDEIWVWEGQWVSANEFIGTVGNTGNSSGAHLHFEIIINGAAVDPLGRLE